MLHSFFRGHPSSRVAHKKVLQKKWKHKTRNYYLVLGMTRMHSSRMRTARSSIRRGGLHQAHPPEADTPLGADTPPSRHPPGADTPPTPLWTEFLTHAYENITLPQTSFAGGKNKILMHYIRQYLEGFVIFIIYVCSSIVTSKRSLPLELSFGTTCCQFVVTWYIGYGCKRQF